MLDERKFLSDYGLRSLSKEHADQPFTLSFEGTHHTISCLPGESDSGMFGGNSNWRGPIWFPINYLMIESLQKYPHYYGDKLKVEMPSGSGDLVDLKDVSSNLYNRAWVAGGDRLIRRANSVLLIRESC